MSLKLSVIGGGSLFVPSMVNGIAGAQKRARVPFEVALSLYDTDLLGAQRMRRYAEAVSTAWGAQLTVSVPTSRAEALSGADLVVVSVWLQDAHQRVDDLHARLGFHPHEEGPAVAAWALALAPWNLELAQEMRVRCPQALFLTLANPTDVLTGIVSEGAGIPAAGLCVEVDGLLGVLAFHLREPYERIELAHAGVNHDGWVLRCTIGGRDGYQVLRTRREGIQEIPGAHPGTRGLWQILDLTGHLRSSAYHHWPYQIAKTAEDERRWTPWRGKRERLERALEDALRTGQPITDPPLVHPEASRLYYPRTGQTIGKLVEAMATDTACLLPLQVKNRGAVENFPEDAIVEVPTSVAGDRLDPQPVGPLPEWLGGTTRLLAVQRRLVIDYVHDRDLRTLKRALAVLPMFGTIQQFNQYAEALHAGFG